MVIQSFQNMEYIMKIMCPLSHAACCSPQKETMIPISNESFQRCLISTHIWVYIPVCHENIIHNICTLFFTLQYIFKFVLYSYKQSCIVHLLAKYKVFQYCTYIKYITNFYRWTFNQIPDGHLTRLQSFAFKSSALMNLFHVCMYIYMCVGAHIYNT